MFWDEFSNIHAIVSGLACFLSLFGIVMAIGGLTQLRNMEPGEWRQYYRALPLFLAISLRSHQAPHFRRTAFKSIVIFILAALVTLEGVRICGVDTNIGSYTEYPTGVSGYYLMVSGGGSKYYKLPAIIRRYNGDDPFHYVEKAFWPNGGVLCFSEEAEVRLNQTTTVYAYDDDDVVSMEVVLTEERCEDSRIPVTQPQIHPLLPLFIWADIMLLAYFLPVKCLFPNTK